MTAPCGRGRRLPPAAARCPFSFPRFSASLSSFFHPTPSALQLLTSYQTPRRHIPWDSNKQYLCCYFRFLSLDSSKEPPSFQGKLLKSAGHAKKPKKNETTTISRLSSFSERWWCCGGGMGNPPLSLCTKISDNSSRFLLALLTLFLGCTLREISKHIPNTYITLFFSVD